MKKLIPHLSKKGLLIAGAFLLTLANGGGLGYAYLQHNKNKSNAPTTALQEIVKPTIDIKSAKEHKTSPTLVGKKIGEGDYKSETLTKSKIQTGNAAQLTIATHKDSGGHFVLAFLDRKSVV